VLCSRGVDQEELVRQFAIGNPGGGAGFIALKRRCNNRHIMIDIIRAINVIGDDSEFRFCAFMNADNIYAVRANRNHVIVGVDTESG
jgi:hypothetical protein